MEFFCEGLPQFGLVLLPPSSAAYNSSLADIQQRLKQPVDGSPPIPEQLRPRISEQDRPTSAILLNQSQKAIAGLQAAWLFETATGRSYRHSRGMLSPQNLLLPFGIPEESLKLYRYWHTILPGSKRYLSESGMAGDNTDVRLPEPEEKWRGGMGGAGSGGAGTSGREQVKQVTLVLDGVFFIDGEFVGPDRDKLYEQIVAQAEARMLVGKIARNGHNNGLSPKEIFAEIEKVTGPPAERPSIPPSVRNADATAEEFRRWALQGLADQFAMQRNYPGYEDERAVYKIMGWTGIVLPTFRKR